MQDSLRPHLKNTTADFPFSVSLLYDSNNEETSQAIHRNTGEFLLMRDQPTGQLLGSNELMYEKLLEKCESSYKHKLTVLLISTTAKHILLNLSLQR